MGAFTGYVSMMDLLKNWDHSIPKNQTNMEGVDDQIEKFTEKQWSSFLESVNEFVGCGFDKNLKPEMLTKGERRALFIVKEARRSLEKKEIALAFYETFVGFKDEEKKEKEVKEEKEENKKSTLDYIKKMSEKL